VRIDLLPAGGQRLNGEFFEAFAEPIEARRCASVLKGEDKVDAGLGCAVGSGRRLSVRDAAQSSANTRTGAHLAVMKRYGDIVRMHCKQTQGKRAFAPAGRATNGKRAGEG